MEREQLQTDRLELYQQFEKNHGQYLREGLPLGAVVIGNIVVGVLVLTGNDTVKDAYGDMRVWLPQAVGGLAAIPLFAHGQRAHDNNKEVAAQIAELEGRKLDPNNFNDWIEEETRIENIIRISERISPHTLESAAFDVTRALSAPVNGFFRLVFNASDQDVMEVTEQTDRQFLIGDFNSMETSINHWFKDNQTRNQVEETILEIARSKWEKVAENKKHPEDRRVHARLVVSEIDNRIQGISYSWE